MQFALSRIYRLLLSRKAAKRDVSATSKVTAQLQSAAGARDEADEGEKSLLAFPLAAT